MIKSYYQNSTSAMLCNSTQGQMYNTTVGVRQGCLLYHVLFNLCIEEIMTAVSSLSVSSSVNSMEFKMNIYLKYQLVAEIYLISDSPMI